MKKNRANKRKLFSFLAALVIVLSGTFAFFTDRTEGSINGQAGDLCIDLESLEGDLDLLAPGDTRDLKVTYSNKGSLAMDTRVTYVLSYELDEVAEGHEDPRFDKIATLTDGDNEVTLTKDDEFVKMTVDSGTLSGTNEDEGEGLISRDLKFHFDRTVGNIGQNMKFTLDVIVEGKQHRHNPKWSTLHTTKIQIHDKDMDVVPVSACNIKDERVILKVNFDSYQYDYDVDFTREEMAEFLMNDVYKNYGRYTLTVKFNDGREEVLQRNVLEIENDRNTGRKFEDEFITEFDLTAMYGDRAHDIKRIDVSGFLDIKEHRDGFYKQFGDCFGCAMSDEPSVPCSFFFSDWDYDIIEKDGNTIIDLTVTLEENYEC